jgi:signal transduction histidine kinase
LERHSRSLRWRLLAGTTVALALALALAGVLLAGLFRQHVTAQFDAELLRQLDQLTASTELDAQARPMLRTPLSDPRWQTPYSGLYWQIELASAPESAVLRSRSLWDAVLHVPADLPEDGEVHRHVVSGPDGDALVVLERTVRFVDSSQADNAPAWRLLVAGQAHEIEAAVAGFSGQLALYLALLGLALLAAAWAQVSLGLRPLRQLQAAVQAVREGRSARLEGPFPAEVAPLVDDFNRVLEQNQQVVTRARNMAGNLAHSIKTPLAVLAGLARQSGHEPDTLARSLREQVDTIHRQVDWHLGRARAASAGVPGLRTPVQPLVDGLVRVMRKVHAHRDDRPPLNLTQTCADNATFGGEAQDLQEMVGNLLDNACKWANAHVAIDVGDADTGLLVTIDDDGPGLDAAQRQAVLERGVRADERVPGSGLGLDIARELAQLYHGELVLAPSPLGGLRATLRLPKG